MAIYYFDWGKHLRWGNFGMIYLNMLSIAERAGNKLILPPYFAWKYFKNPPEISKGNEEAELFHFRQFNWSQDEEDYLVDFFTKNRDKNININLGSHLQSDRWSLANKEYAIKMMEIKDEEIQRVKERYSHIFNGKKIIAVGVRLGDFQGSNCFFQLPMKWYLSALKTEFPDWQECNILFLSDDIEKLKQIFKGDNFYFATPNGTHSHANGFRDYHKDPFEQFILGTLADGFVGGSSTFTWLQMWYVSNKGGKCVVSGENLVGDCQKRFYNPNYYSESWTLHPVKY